VVKNSVLLILLCSFFLAASAQDKDSLALVSTDWKITSIAPNVSLKIAHFSAQQLFNANENISYLELTPQRKQPGFDFGYGRKLLKTTADFALEKQAIAAVNGSFFDVKNGGSVDFLKYGDTVITENRLEKNGSRARHQRSAITIHKGKLKLEQWNGKSTWEKSLKAEHVLLTGPMLSFKGKNQELDTTSFTNARHPRTAVGIKKDGKIILLTVDGRNAQSAGMSLHELNKIMRWLGCFTVINLDGGGSTTLWVAGADNNGVINFPSDNKLWDHEGQRKVANVLLITKKP